jgi:hypothetical protein
VNVPGIANSNRGDGSKIDAETQRNKKNSAAKEKN